MRAALALNGLTTFSCFILGEADPNWPVLKNYNFMDTTDSGHTKRIMTFGDSLTEGYLQNGQKFYPYSTLLEKMLNKHSVGIRFEVINEGISGECVYKEMAPRLPKLLDNYKSRLDLIIILGGTNDLRKLDCLHKVNVGYEITNLHNIAHNRNIKTVALTIPEAEETNVSLTYHSQAVYKKLWQKTNDQIRHYAQTNKNMTFFLDLAKKLPLNKLTKMVRKKYWDDHLHPSRCGYKKMANLLYTLLKHIFGSTT